PRSEILKSAGIALGSKFHPISPGCAHSSKRLSAARPGPYAYRGAAAIGVFRQADKTEGSPRSDRHTATRAANGTHTGTGKRIPRTRIARHRLPARPRTGRIPGRE